MTITLLEAINAVCDEVGLPSTGFVTTSTDDQIRQLFALAKREGREQITAPSGWPQFRGEQTITMVNGQAAYDFPTDFESYIPQTIWDRDKRWPVNGPLTAQQWQYVKSGMINALPYMRFRIMQGQIYFDPTPDSSIGGETVVIEYQSNGYCQSASGTPQSTWLADTDVWRLPDDILTLGIKWRFLAAKRLDYSEEKSAWSDMCDREMAKAYGLKTLSLNNLAWPDMWGRPMIQDGNWPGRS